MRDKEEEEERRSTRRGCVENLFVRRTGRENGTRLWGIFSGSLAAWVWLRKMLAGTDPCQPVGLGRSDKTDNVKCGKWQVATSWYVHRYSVTTWDIIADRNTGEKRRARAGSRDTPLALIDEMRPLLALYNVQITVRVRTSTFVLTLLFVLGFPPSQTECRSKV
jgi:hypothetical protein